MFGASMAAPLAMPPTVKPSPATTISFGTVSVVMMALAASAADSRRPVRAMTIGSISGMTWSIGKGIPMRPVWQIRISSAVAPMSPATAVHSRSAASRPGSPGGRVGIARGQDHRRGRATRRLQMGAAHLDGRRRRQVGREDAGGRARPGRRRWRRRRRRAPWRP